MASVRCDKCDSVFKFKPENIRKSVVEQDGVAYELAYFMCPVCCTVSLFSVADAKWYELRSDLEKAKTRYRRYCRIGDKSLVDNAFRTLLKKHERLGNYSDSLFNKFRGKLTVDSLGKLQLAK